MYRFLCPARLQNHSRADVYPRRCVLGLGTAARLALGIPCRHGDLRLLGGIDIVACRRGGGIGVVFGKTQPVGKARARVVKCAFGFQAAFGMTRAEFGAA